MNLNSKIINPVIYPRWDELLLSHPDYSFFHTSYWARVLSESYGYKPLYFTEINNGKLVTLIPLMEVNSILTGKRGVSLPFTDYCNLIINAVNNDLMGYLIDYGKGKNWKYIEMRGSGDFLNGAPSSSNYYRHILDLSRSEEQIFSNFRSSTKRNIKKAIREGVKVNIDNSLESIREFYRLNCMTRKDHGLPPQPYFFFKNIYNHIISENHGIVVSASFKGKIIAGAVYFHFGEKALYKYGASDRRYQHFRANNLIMWEAIKWYCQQGYKSFCFGKTEHDNKGLIQFKTGWGAKEKIIKYYKYDLKRESFVTQNSKVTGVHNRIFSKTPIPLLKIFGSLLYKHVG
jgi:hypothetical protein